MRAPRTLEQSAGGMRPLRPFLTMDLLPTILDALNVAPEIISKYAGHSIFRNRGREYDRETYHANNPGGNALQVVRKQKDHHYKAVLFKNPEDVCATDLFIDPDEQLFYCVNEGWRKGNVDDKLVDGLSTGHWKEGSRDETLLIEWAHEADDLLRQHFGTNAQMWDLSKAEEHAAAHKEFLASLAAVSSASANQ